MTPQSEKPWNDINNVGFSSGRTNEIPENRVVTGVEEDDSVQEECEPEMRLISAVWEPGPNGFNYKEKCILVVKGEYLKKTIRARIRGKLFGIYNGEEVDLSYEVEGFVDKQTSLARMVIKSLFFVNNDHYFAWQKDKNVAATYMIKGIFHSRGENTLDSPSLEIPATVTIIVDFIEMPDLLFNHNSAVPCIDKNDMFISIMAATLYYASNNSEKETVLYGHTDSSGEIDYNMNLSGLRAKAVKAFLDKDKDSFIQVCKDKSKVEDYQTMLSVLTSNHGWNCGPGKIDNVEGSNTMAALKSFQTDYNLKFKKSIDQDGKIGPQTWGAFFDVVHALLWQAASAKITGSYPVLKYGENGSGIHPCGETFAQDTNTKKGRRSQKDRRVEIVFKMVDDLIDDTPYNGPVIMNPIEIGTIVIQPESIRVVFLGKW
jgi:peptidoglycan hydrolase-like protein with peptidoglycan-binding domain